MADSVYATHLDAGNKDEDIKNEEKRPTSGHQPVSPLQQLPSNPHPLTPVPKLSSSGECTSIFSFAIILIELILQLTC